MNVRALTAIVFCALATPFAPAPEAADTLREVHGSGDAFALPGMAIAWGVLRGAGEEGTRVVIRIATEPAQFADVAVLGSDPFTQAQEVMLAMAPSSGVVDVRTLRAHYARFPRTELRFYSPAASRPDRTPSLVVFYLGVPDTTPEFADEAKLDAYLRERIAKVRGRSSPYVGQ